jgi:uncharacterized damage-inducible protein DinB
MNEVLKTQYALTQRSREIVLNFIETEVGNDLYTPVAIYADRTVRDVLEHVACCYFQWLAAFAMKKSVKWLDSEDLITIGQIRVLYYKVDEAVTDFLEDFKYRRDPISGVHNAAGHVSATTVQLFTHVTSHEFHHKGQMMSMCRILGHTPPETDMSLFFEQADHHLSPHTND